MALVSASDLAEACGLGRTKRGYMKIAALARRGAIPFVRALLPSSPDSGRKFGMMFDLETGVAAFDARGREKPCGACGRVLPVDQFRKRKDGTPSHDCTACHKAYNETRRRDLAEAAGRRYVTWAEARQAAGDERARRAAERAARPKKTKEQRTAEKVAYQRARYASDPAYQATVKAKKIKRKRAIDSAYVEPVNREVVAARDGWKCAICGRRVTRKTWSIDHVKPLSKGGDHSYRNVVLAHRRCNSARGAGRLASQAPLFAQVLP